MNLQQNCCKLNFLIKFALSICKFMIPEFDEYGRLPAGIHVATLSEFEERFVVNFPRKEIFKDLIRLLKDFKTINCIDIYIDGSFVTSENQPNDIDICWGDERVKDEKYLQSLFDKNPNFILRLSSEIKIDKCDIHAAYLIETKTKRLYIDFFQIDKETNKAKGIIKLNI